MKNVLVILAVMSSVVFSGVVHAGTQEILNNNLKKYKFACEEQNIYDLLIPAGSIQSYYRNLEDRVNYQKWSKIWERILTASITSNLKDCANDTRE